MKVTMLLGRHGGVCVSVVDKVWQNLAKKDEKQEQQGVGGYEVGGNNDRQQRG